MCKCLLTMMVGCVLIPPTFAIEPIDWPQWRGPDRTGILTDGSTPTNWPKQLPEVWKVTVGEGHSSPIVIGERIYQFARQDQDEVLWCLDRTTGKVQWSERYPQEYEVNSAAIDHGKGPKSTPVYDRGTVFTLGIAGTLSAIHSESGKLRWRKQFGDRFRVTSPLYGTAMSPIVVDGRLIAHIGGNDKGSLLALDPATGNTIWEASTDGPSYASPIIATLGSKRQLITYTQQNLLGIDLITGKTSWKLDYTTEYTQNVITPVISGDLVIGSGYNNPLTAYRMPLMGGNRTPVSVWSERKLPLYMSSPIAIDGKIFGFTHRNSGKLFAVNAKDGKLLWESETRLGENASLVVLNDHLLVLTTEGKLIIQPISATKFAPIAEYTVSPTPTWASGTKRGSDFDQR